MTEPTTVNKGLIIPNTGDLPGTWGSAALNPDFNAIDGMLGGVVSLPSSSFVLTAPAGSISPGAGPTQAQNAVLRFTSALTTNISVGLPLPGFYIIENLATPSADYVILLYATNPGGGDVLATPYGSRTQIFSDGTNVRFVPGLGDFPGALTFMAGNYTFPIWINVCTTRPYQFCDGATFLISKYPVLASLFGTKFGGDGVTTSATPNLSGRMPLQYDFSGGLITAAGCGINGQSIGAFGGTQNHQLNLTEIPSHNHGVIEPNGGQGHRHGFVAVTQAGYGAGGTFQATGGATANTNLNTGYSQSGVGVDYAPPLGQGDQPHINVQPSMVTGVWLVKT